MKPGQNVKHEDPEQRLAGFIAKYAPPIAKLAKAALAKMRARLPGACELVYDNYNALAIGFGPTDRTADLIFSITLYPRWKAVPSIWRPISAKKGLALSGITKPMVCVFPLRSERATAFGW